MVVVDVLTPRVLSRCECMEDAGELASSGRNDLERALIEVGCPCFALQMFLGAHVVL